MEDHVDAALFVHTPETRRVLARLTKYRFGVSVRPVEFDALMKDPESLLAGTEHVVVAAPLDVIKSVLRLSMQYGFSVGLIPLSSQKDLLRGYGLPTRTDAAIDVALRRDARPVDLILCNGEIMLCRATVGRLPLLDSAGDTSWPGMAVKAVKRLSGLKLLPFRFTTAGKRKIRTAACGCMIVQNHAGNLASRLFEHESSIRDGMISLVISAPRSLASYLKFVVQTLGPFAKRRKLPHATGFIKSRRIDIDTEVELKVNIDGMHATTTPLQCEVLPEAVRLNMGEKLRRETRKRVAAKESISTVNLPTGKEELARAKKKAIPFFSYASEDRFRDLFLALRDDAQLNMIYMVLMVLSTMLATVGLYQNSTAVVIGAMLLAPLMSPIVSLAMGLLRGEERLVSRSAIKIVYGVTIALLAAALMTLLFPHKPITPEMQGRLNPTLLDLAVAIVAGAAGAYTKAYKEILQSLAGVAIAVALVPPLAVAGIGIGRLDFYFFAQAFLLFLTNLVGITLAATFTFRVLGYSSAVQRKWSVNLVVLALALIAVPLYYSYDQIVQKVVMEKSWKKERFLVNGKYIIVKEADLSHQRDKEVMIVTIMAREPLTREDLTEFKSKIQRHFDKKLVIRAKIVYIL
ncbi:MAG: TIGR00341 family protein [Pseudomonadota bacterium]|nr:TIGR00341 family protein [Pseudomonadota bacterium]